jgi:hypothetical protein
MKPKPQHFSRVVAAVQHLRSNLRHETALNTQTRMQLSYPQRREPVSHAGSAECLEV